MKQSRILVCAVLVALAAVATPTCVEAQGRSAEESRRAREAKRAKALQAKQEVKVEAKYPLATRVSPPRTGSKIVAEFNKMVELTSADKPDEAIAAAEAVLANPKANNYERSVAAQAAAYAWMEKDGSSYANPVKYMERALAENGLDNNTHYDMMYQLAQTHLVDDRYDQALELLGRFLSETKSEKPEAYALQGNAYYRQDKFDLAIEALNKAIAASPNPDKSWSPLLMASYFEAGKPLEAARIAEEVAAKNPDDKTAQLNLASIYMQADQMAKAAGVFDRLRAAGKLTEAKDYETGYKLLANVDGREKDAIGLINEGLGKGILQPSFDVYNFLGQAHYFADQIPEAVAAWTKASPLDKDGETELNLAKVLVQEDKGSAQALKHARQAIARGVKKPGDAWVVIARAENDLGNRAGMIAAYREAAKHPETRESAGKMLRQLGAK